MITSITSVVCRKIDGFKIDGLTSALELSGCTNVTANIEIEIRAGPSEYYFSFKQSNSRTNMPHPIVY